MDILADAFLLQVVIISFWRSLLGEAVREVNNTTPISFSHFVVEFLAGGFIALMLAIVLKVMVFKEDPIMVLPMTGFLAFAGRKRSAALIDRILTTFLSRGGQINDTKPILADEDKSDSK